MVKIFLFLILGVLASHTCAKKATCLMQADPNYWMSWVYGNVTLTQASPDSDLVIKASLYGFAPVMSNDTDSQDLMHGFHIHEFGDIIKGCKSAGSHYNPDGNDHGAPDDENRHAGGLGNRAQNEYGEMITEFTDHVATLYGEKSVIGRAIVIHEGADDLGRGGNEGSKKHGNAGPRIACCTIGLAKDDAF